ncbi:DUF2490 domain-containing protein [Polaribacter sp.]|uniref:DUF2490 domain-containing protein n=1 Tax=Polaribacter sp. TaxID=1920175 RepID=UPI004047DCC4
MKKIFFPFFYLVSGFVFSQSNFELGLLPKAIFSKEISEKTKWINSVELRTILYDDNFQITHSLIDLSTILSQTTGLNQSFNFGYILRARDQEIIHRTFQYYNFVNQYGSLKLAHRFAFEQFFQSKKRTTYRIRYQISAEKPLNGERVDVNEFYLKMGNEYLYNFDNNLEIRFTPYLGFRATKKDRIEIGFDYRISEFIENSTMNNLWFRTTWYISLD